MPDPGRFRVIQLDESELIDDLIDPNADISSSFSDDEWYLDREGVEDTAPPSKVRKTNTNSKIVCLIQVKYKI